LFIYIQELIKITLAWKKKKMSEFIEHKYILQDKIQKRLYQELLLAEAVNQDTLVVVPTGLGKTIVAVLLIAHSYSQEKSIIFMAPTKPLASQHKDKLLNALNIDSEKIILITGQTPPATRKEIYKESGLIICATPQTIDNDIQAGIIDRNKFNLIIFDEAHRAVGNYAYCNIADFFKDNRKLALTASPGSKRAKIEDVVNNLHLSKVEIRTEEDVDVCDYTQDVVTEVIHLELDESSKKISSLLDQFIKKKIQLLRKFNFRISANQTKREIIQLQAQIFSKISKTKDNRYFFALSATASILKLFHAKELIESQGIHSFENYLSKLDEEARSKKASKAIKEIINSAEIIHIRKILADINYNSIEYSKEKKLIELVTEYVQANPKSKILVFSNFRDNASHLMEVLNKNKFIKSARFVGQASKTNDKGLSQKEQLSILVDFKDGVYNTLVCTSVGEEGLDIPSVDLVIFYDAVPSEIRAIQRRGRTGRFNVGKVIVLLNKDTIDDHYYYVSMNKENTMKRVLRNYNTRKPSAPRKKKVQKTIADF
jgi:ERCC4-related helicase